MGAAHFVAVTEAKKIQRDGGGEGLLDIQGCFLPTAVLRNVAERYLSILSNNCREETSLTRLVLFEGFDKTNKSEAHISDMENEL